MERARRILEIAWEVSNAALLTWMFFLALQAVALELITAGF